MIERRWRDELHGERAPLPPSGIVVDRSCMAIAIAGHHLAFQPTSFRLVSHLIDNYGQWVRSDVIRATVLRTTIQPGASNIRWHVLQARLALCDFRTALHSDRALGVMFRLTPCERRHCREHDGRRQLRSGISSPGFAK